MSWPTKFEGNWGIDSDPFGFYSPRHLSHLEALLLSAACATSVAAGLLPTWGRCSQTYFFGRGCFAGYFKVSTDGCFC